MMPPAGMTKNYFPPTRIVLQRAKSVLDLVVMLKERNGSKIIIDLYFQLGTIFALNLEADHFHIWPFLFLFCLIFVQVVHIK